MIYARAIAFQLYHGDSMMYEARKRKPYRTFLLGLFVLFYAIAITFQLYNGDDMMYEMRKRKPDPTLYGLKGSLTSHTMSASY